MFNSLTLSLAFCKVWQGSEKWLGHFMTVFASKYPAPCGAMFHFVKIFTKSVKELVLMHCVCRLEVFRETDPSPC